MASVDKQQLRAVLDALKEVGVSDLVCYLRDEWGSRTLAVDIDDTEAFLADPVAFRAALFRVSREKFLAWESFMIHDGGQCRGTTKRGRRCRTSLRCSAEEFAIGISDHCDRHRGFH